MASERPLSRCTSDGGSNRDRIHHCLLDFHIFRDYFPGHHPTKYLSSGGWMKLFCPERRAGCNIKNLEGAALMG